MLVRICGAFVLLCVTLFLHKYFSEPRFIERAMRQYKDFAFQKLTQKSISSFRDEGTATYLSALTNDAASIESDYLAQQLSLITKATAFFGALTDCLSGFTVVKTFKAEKEIFQLFAQGRPMRSSAAAAAENPRCCTC